MDRDDLIPQIIGLQKEISQLIMEYRIENWLSLDLSIAQLKSLIYIHSKGRSNFRELAEALDVTPPVVTGIVDRLVLHGLIQRVRGQQDRRVQWLVLSDKGRALQNDITQKVTKEFHDVLKILSDEDLSALVQSFAALIKAAKTYLQSQQKGVDATQLLA